MEKTDIIIGIDNNVPIIYGECQSCKRGQRSLILIDYVPSRKNSVDSTIYVKCICCRMVYQSKVKDVSR